MREEIDLGTFEIDPTDPMTKNKLKKFFAAISEDDFTYKPFQNINTAKEKSNDITSR